jgi:hypothetical protein
MRAASQCHTRAEAPGSAVKLNRCLQISRGCRACSVCCLPPPFLLSPKTGRQPGSVLRRPSTPSSSHSAHSSLVTRSWSATWRLAAFPAPDCSHVFTRRLLCYTLEARTRRWIFPRRRLRPTRKIAVSHTSRQSQRRGSQRPRRGLSAAHRERRLQLSLADAEAA